MYTILSGVEQDDEALRRVLGPMNVPKLVAAAYPMHLPHVKPACLSPSTTAFFICGSGEPIPPPAPQLPARLIIMQSGRDRRAGDGGTPRVDGERDGRGSRG